MNMFTNRQEARRVRRKDDTLRDTLLALARETADREGLEAVNIRALAGRAGVAAGTVYNYFSSKDEILLALTEEYWRGALEELDAAVTAGDFCGQVREIFLFVRERLQRSAGTLMGSLDKVETAGQERMAAMKGRLERDLVRRMEGDPSIRGEVWDGDFTRERFARFLMGNMTALWGEKEPDVDLLLAVIRKTIY